MSYILDALRKSEEERRRGNLPDPRDFSRVEERTSGRKRWLWPVVAGGLLLINLVGVLLWWAPWQPDAATQVPVVQSTPAPAPQVTKTASPAIQPTVAPPAVSEPVTAKPVTTPLYRSEKKPTATPAPVATVPSLAPSEPASVVSDRPRPEPIAKRVQPTQSRPAVEPEPVQVEPVQVEPNTSLRAGNRRQHGYLPQLADLPASLRRQLPELVFSSHMYANVPRYRSIIINGRRLKEGQYLAGDLIVHEITESGVVMKLNDTLFEVDVLSQW